MEIRTIEQEVTEERASSLGVVDAVLRALRDLRYGEVTLTVHDGAIVQIDRTETLRFSPRRTHR